MQSRGLRWRWTVSSPVMHLDLLLKIPPDEVLFDFLEQCGLILQAADVDVGDDVCERLRIAVAIELAPAAVRGAVLAGLRHVAALADAAGLTALRKACHRSGDRVPALHLPDAPAQCALWVYLRHRDLFDAALRLRGLLGLASPPLSLEPVREPLPLPDDPVVRSVRLVEATLLDETTGGEIAVRVPFFDPHLSVLEMLATWMPTDNPMAQHRFRIIAAGLEIELYPESSGASAQSVTLELKRRGGSNLNDFDARTRARLEAWLNHWRLLPALQAGQDATLAPTN